MYSFNMILEFRVGGKANHWINREPNIFSSHALHDFRTTKIAVVLVALMQSDFVGF